ncbi:MAG: hypothetical protein RJA70_668 [Pseudomonadota bacterium]|jgi:pheromone shutdown-related protein TraB
MSDSGHVTRLEYQGKEIHLIGTAHISQKSVDEVQRVIRELKPDTVCVELDTTRYESMVDENRFRKLDIFQIIRQKKVLYLLSSLVLTSFQRRMGEKLGVKPGAELLAAVHCAKEVGAELVLADRDIQATLKRSWFSLGFMDRVNLISAMLGSFFTSNEITEAQIEELKDRDTISEMMAEFARHMPRLQVPLIDERDRFLMSTIQEAPGKVIVAVVGAGHVRGMVGYLGQAVDRAALSVIPKSSLLVRSMQWVIPAILLLSVLLAWPQSQGEGLKDMAQAWILSTSLGALFFTAVAGGRPLTVLTAAVVAPLTTLHPTLGAGMIAGLVEAWVRKPTVEDCEGINDAILSVKGMYRNGFTRVLLVAVGATIGAALGAWVGTGLVVRLL